MSFWFDTSTSNTLLAIFTFVLAVATVILAVATWRMATSARDSVALESRPYFAFKELRFKFFMIQPTEGDAASPQRANVQVGLVFRNPGRVLIHYEVKAIQVTLNNTGVESPSFESLGSPIYPNEQAEFWYVAIPQVDVSAFPRTGMIEYTVEYRGIPEHTVHTSYRKIRYTIHRLEPHFHDWVFLDQKDA